VAIVGLGLMGGALARTLRAGAPGVRIHGIDPDTLVGARALDDGVIDRFALPGERLASEADLVVLSAPLGAALAFIGDEGPHLGADTLVTDVVSLNAPLLRRGRAAGVSSRLVTAHPLCGSERSGYAEGPQGLYDGARVFLSAVDDASPRARNSIEGFWRAVGGVPEWIDAEEHDRRMAWVSHLPQLVANALAGALDAAGFEPVDLGPGGRDMTRLAGSSPAMWKELLAESAQVTGTGLTSVSRALNVVADLLARRDIDRIAEFMEVTREWSRASEPPPDSEPPRPHPESPPGDIESPHRDPGSDPSQGDPT
jgi:prephenate dehydrogenase